MMAVYMESNEFDMRLSDVSGQREVDTNTSNGLNEFRDVFFNGSDKHKIDGTDHAYRGI